MHLFRERYSRWRCATLICFMSDLSDAASRISKSKIEKTEAAVGVAFGLLAAPSVVGQELFDPSLFDPAGVLLRDPDVYSVEVHNQGSAGFSMEMDVGSDGWDQFSGSCLVRKEIRYSEDGTKVSETYYNFTAFL